MEDTTSTTPTSPPPSHALVLTGGERHTSPPDRDWHIVIAADSGYDHAIELGMDVDVLIGDLDSISASALEHAHTRGVDVRTHPRDKDETDLELALRLAISLGHTAVTIVGGEGGRLSHLLSTALVLADAQWTGVSLEWHTGTGVARTAAPGNPVALEDPIGATVSLLPVGTATGVTTSGMKWELESEALPTGTTRGLSNQIVNSHAVVSVSSGVLIVVSEGTVA